VQQYNGVPPYAETQNYVTGVLGFADQFRAGAATTSATTSALPLATAPVLATTTGSSDGDGALPYSTI
jgi:hypothetical protein